MDKVTRTPPHSHCKSTSSMDAPPPTVQERHQPVNLTINAPDTPDQNILQQYPPPSATSLASCPPSVDATAPIMSPGTATSYPALSPAWETKECHHHQHQQIYDPPSPAGRPDGLPLLTCPPTTTLDPPSSPIPAVAAGPPRDSSSANLRPDMMPPSVAGAIQHRAPASLAAPEPAALEAVAAASLVQPEPSAPPAPAPAPLAGPSPGASEIVGAGTASETETARRGFFRSSTGTPPPHTSAPPSSSSGMSAIFHLDLDTPVANAVLSPVDVMVQDLPRTNVEDLEESAGDSSSAFEAAACGSNNSAAPSLGYSVPWGAVGPSPDNSQPLQGPWGRLQEVCSAFIILCGNFVEMWLKENNFPSTSKYFSGEDPNRKNNYSKFRINHHVPGYVLIFFPVLLTV